MNTGAHSLDSIPLFESMSEERRTTLAARCRWREVPRGQQIIDRDDENSDVYFVTSGRVRIVNFSASGREISFEDLDEGAFFGEIAAFDEGVRSASVVARTKTKLAVMPAETFINAITSEPGVCREVLAHMAQTVRRATDRIMDLSTVAANNRVQAEILRLARTTEKDDGSSIINPVPVHSDIASRVSTTRETVARVMSDLTKMGLVEKQSKGLVISDLEALEDLVDEVGGHM